MEDKGLRHDVCAVIRDALNALESQDELWERNNDLQQRNRRLEKELEKERKKVKELEHALKAEPYPDCLTLHDDGEDYPPDPHCDKWDVWMDKYENSVCDECKGRFGKEQLLEALNRKG